MESKTQIVKTIKGMAFLFYIIWKISVVIKKKLNLASSHSQKKLPQTNNLTKNKTKKTQKSTKSKQNKKTSPKQKQPYKMSWNRQELFLLLQTQRRKFTFESPLSQLFMVTRNYKPWTVLQTYIHNSFHNVWFNTLSSGKSPTDFNALSPKQGLSKDCRIQSISFKNTLCTLEEDNLSLFIHPVPSWTWHWQDFCY